MIDDTDIMYYECHVTIDPVFGDDLEKFKRVCKSFRFRPANLLMVKGTTPQSLMDYETSNIDCFCTYKGGEYDTTFSLMTMFSKKLSENGFKVKRAKIEAALFDERYK